MFLLLLTVVLQFITKNLHKGLFLIFFIRSELLLRGDNNLLRLLLFLWHLLWIGIEVIMNELEYDVLVVIESLDIAVQLQKMGCHLVLKIIELHGFSCLLTQSPE